MCIGGTQQVLTDNFVMQLPLRCVFELQPRNRICVCLFTFPLPRAWRDGAKHRNIVMSTMSIVQLYKYTYRKPLQFVDYVGTFMISGYVDSSSRRKSIGGMDESSCFKTIQYQYLITYAKWCPEIYSQRYAYQNWSTVYSFHVIDILLGDNVYGPSSPLASLQIDVSTCFKSIKQLLWIRAVRLSFETPRYDY